MERGETTGKVMMLKEGKYQSNDKCNKVRQCDDKFLDISNIALEGVHSDKCQIKYFQFYFIQVLFPSRKSFMPSENKIFTFDFRQFCCKQVSTEIHGNTVRRIYFYI